jgi:predicted DCC family thiol-disulfide oxidoreductase YuxK
MAHPILLYDGVCGLCNRLVQFILRRDRDAVFHFASLQSDFAAGIVTRHAANPSDLDTFYVVLSDNHEQEFLLSRSDAAVYVLKRLSPFWRILGFFLGILPRSLRDWAYQVIARNRYRLFGRYEACPIPAENVRARFLDLDHS